MTSTDFELVSAALVEGARIVALAEVDSTNEQVHRSEPDQWRHGDVVIAHHQRAGKGRAGRTWLTPAGSAVTMTVLVQVDEPGYLPLVAGLAIHDELARLGCNPGLKWPNDVLLPGGEHLDGWGRFRKVAGVLCELVASYEPERPGGPARHLVAVGMGVNVTCEPVEHATSLRAAGVEIGVDELAARVYEGFLAAVQGWQDNPANIQARVQQASVTLGRRVEFSLGGRRVMGVAEKISASGALMVRVGSDLHQVLAGDVTLQM